MVRAVCIVIAAAMLLSLVIPAIYAVFDAFWSGMILPGPAIPYVTRLVRGSAGWERVCGYVEEVEDCAKAV